MIRKWVVIACSCMSLLLFAFAWHNPTASSVVASPQSIDFGRHTQGEILTDHVTITNNLRHAISIVQVYTSCRCFIVESPRGKTLDPAESVRVPIKWNTSDSLGRMSQEIHFVYRLGSDSSVYKVAKTILNAEIVEKTMGNESEDDSSDGATEQGELEPFS